jgi:hypothetical protein
MFRMISTTFVALTLASPAFADVTMLIKMSGGGPMGALMGKMGGMSSTTSVQSVEASPLADDLFAPPAGYKLKAQK